MESVTADPAKCLIVSIYMDNINPKTIDLHRAVMTKFSAGYNHLYAKTKLGHGETMDALWNSEVVKKVDHLMFLDIDAIPLSKYTLPLMFDGAAAGALLGNVQRSNHLDNNQHMFVAPSAVCMSVATYNKIGRPSAVPTLRGDVGEEYTYAAEASGVRVKFFWPLRHDRPVARMDWEADRSLTWKLADGYPEYGVGTTFTHLDHPMLPSPLVPKLPLIWHSFQSFHPGNQELFWNKCEEVLQ